MSDYESNSEKLLKQAYGYLWSYQDSFSTHFRTSFLLNFILIFIVLCLSELDLPVWFFLFASAAFSLIVSLISVAIQDVYLGMIVKDEERRELHSLEFMALKTERHEQWASSVPKRLLVGTVSCSLVWLVLILAVLIF